MNTEGWWEIVSIKMEPANQSCFHLLWSHAFGKRHESISAIGKSQRSWVSLDLKYRISFWLFYTLLCSIGSKPHYPISAVVSVASKILRDGISCLMVKSRHVNLTKNGLSQVFITPQWCIGPQPHQTICWYYSFYSK